MNTLISGAAGNLGRAACELFTSQQFEVHALMLPGDQFDLKAPGLTRHDLDLLDQDACRLLIESLHPCPIVAFLCAGGFGTGDLEKTEKKTLEKMFNLNFFTAFHLAKPLWLRWQTEGINGRLFVMGAKPAVEKGIGTGMIGYTLSKNLLVKFVEQLNAGKRNSDQRAFVIAPDTIDTPANREAMPDADFSKWVDPGDIAQLVLHLCSNPGRTIAQQVIKIYGAG